MQRVRDLRHDESGFSLIELMVAMVICVVGVMSTLVVLDTSRTISDRSEAREVVAFHAERELERIVAFPWNRLMHRSMPVASAGTPAADIDTVTQAYRFDKTPPGRSEPLKISTNPTAVPAGQFAAETVSSDWIDPQTRLKGKVWRFITFDATDLQGWTRRVTVVATIDAPSDVPPVLLSTIVTDPRP